MFSVTFITLSHWVAIHKSWLKEVLVHNLNLPIRTAVLRTKLESLEIQSMRPPDYGLVAS